MQVIKPMALGLTTRCIEYRRRLGLVVTGSVFFPFRPPGEQAIWTETSMWKFGYWSRRFAASSTSYSMLPMCAPITTSVGCFIRM